MKQYKIGMGSLLVVLLCACSTTQESSAPLTGSASEQSRWTASDSPRKVPAVLEMRGPTTVAPHSEFDVEIVLLRRSASAQPVSLKVSLPQGVELVSGALAETITDPAQEKIVRKLRIRIGEIPEQDIVAEADARLPGAGYHAKGDWGFGRPARKLNVPVAAPNPVVIRGRNLGRPIVMQK